MKDAEKRLGGLAEAPASVTWRMCHGAASFQFTLRDADERVLIVRLLDFIEHATKNDFKLGESESGQTSPAESTASEKRDKMPFGQLSLAIVNGSLVGRVKGGPFTQYGIPVYRETIERALGKKQDELTKEELASVYNVKDVHIEMYLRADGKSARRVTHMAIDRGKETLIDTEDPF